VQAELSVNRPLSSHPILLGNSPAMRALTLLCERCATTIDPVFIVGESGTGKDMVATLIHHLSARRGPLITVNCGAINESLTHSEFFGHEQGSFTGAMEAAPGYFESADGGTLFLDELADMPPALQTQLLRTLETGTYRRLGGTTIRRSDVRLICAMNQNPFEAVKKGLLRMDLLHRLLVIPVTTPPLRTRSDDIGVLARHFVEELNAASGQVKHLPEDAGTVLEGYHWPGNIRELRNFIQRIYIMSGKEEVLDIQLRHNILPSPLVPDTRPVGENLLQVKVGTSLLDTQQALIEATLMHHHGNKRHAAKTLDLSLKTLYNRLQTTQYPQAKEPI
jgi:two-component system response regulator HydG